MIKQPYALYDFHIWAYARIFNHLEELPEEVFHAEVTSVFPSVAQTFGHLYVFERLYHSVLSEVPIEEIFPHIPVWTAEAKDIPVDGMRRLFAGAAEEFHVLMEHTPDPDKAMTIVHPSYGSLDTCFSDILRHVVNHGTYHRGNVTAMLRQQGYSGVPTDYLFFLMECSKK
ncbi:DinB family protein [Paenibacillus sp. FSL H8-0332]|uniref:DinB family protein n=1 Tax=Paenibacillus sp. FSL H8-0332 TaxID=2954742 RepID=UPI0030CEB67D